MNQKTLYAQPSPKDPSLLQLSCALPAIYLVGPMGAGKTTLGKLIAKQLNRSFVDCDHYIKEQTGAEISWIFAKEGEEGFRTRESRALMELTQLPKIVMATGGGAIMCAKNRALLSSSGVVVYLKANVDTQLLRTKKDKNRPLLQNDNPKAVLEALFLERDPLYEEVADIVVATGRMHPKQMLMYVLDALCDYTKTLGQKI